MKKKLLSLALTAIMVAAFVPVIAPAIVPAALGAGSSIVLPLNTELVENTVTHANWEVGVTPNLTAEMLLTANRLEVTWNSAHRSLSLYANGGNNGWWDTAEICELGAIGGKYIFNLEWKRGVFTDTDGNGLSLGCAGWNENNTWTSTRGMISEIRLFYGYPLEHPHIDNIGTLLSVAPSNPFAGRVSGQPFINAADVTMLRRYIQAGNSSTGLTGFMLANADVNGDGSIDIRDVTLLRRHLAATDPSTVPLGLQAPGPPIPWNQKPIQDNVRWYTAITIDDGPVWGPSTTGSTMPILNALANAKAPCGVAARATWFICAGRVVPQYEPLIKRMVGLGHDIEHHTWGHGNFELGPNGETLWPGQPNVAGFTPVRFKRDLDAAYDKIDKVTGRKPLYFRFPQFQSGSHAAAVNAAGMRVIHAYIDSNDFRGQSISTLVNTFKDGGQFPSDSGRSNGAASAGGWDGMVMLWHDAGGDASSNLYTRNNAEVFRQALPDLQAMGYAFVTVEELFRTKNFTPATGTGDGHWNGRTT